MTEQPMRPAIAITGMACLLPGARDVAAYWRNILSGADVTSEPPPEAWDPDVYYDPGFEDKDRTYCKRGGYLGDLATFDPLANGVPPVAVGGEPDQWLALQVARDALADAGASELSDEIRTRTSIVLGKGTYLNGGNAVALQRGLVIGQTIDLLRRLHPEHSAEYLEALRREMGDVLPPLGPDTVPGLIPNIIVGRIANRLDLNGPAYTVDAACASSLVAIQHAVSDLRDGSCDLALAGGSQVWMPAATMNLFSRLGALSRRQRLRAFDKDGDGTLLGEGIGMVVLKRLEEAVRDGDRVYALIRGVGVSSDGHGVSVMAPRSEGQVIALRRAYEDAGVSPDTVDLIEAHGTGTPVGDVTEVQSLTEVFGARDALLPHVALGSVKSMISHTIPAAGVASVIKTALALHHRVLPPTLCEEPNPALELERTPFYINTETRPWIHGGDAPRRAGVNAFGFGGINAHAVLEEFDGGADAPAPGHRAPWPTELCVLEAADAAGLADAADALATAIGVATPRWTLAELAATLAGERGAVTSPARLAIVAESLADLRAKLAKAAAKMRSGDCTRIRGGGIYYESEPLGREGRTVFVFPGEGCQYPKMLTELCQQFDEARAVFDQIDRVYKGHERGHLLSDWVFPRPVFSEPERRGAAQRLMELDVAVESVLTANAALHAVVRRLVPGVDALVGHSTGEHSAAIAAGVLDVSSDERLATFCHGLHASYEAAAGTDELPAAMLLALGTDAGTARAIADEAGGELYVAMDNCPHQVVVLGEPAAAERAREVAAAQGVVCEVLPYDRAVHTPRFSAYAEQLRPVFDQLPVAASEIELWSSTTAGQYPGEVGEIRDLLVDHWTHPVRFRETIEALYEDGARLFVEVGPRGNLTAFTQDILRGRPMLAVAADSQRRSGVTGLNHLVAQLAVHDVAVDLDPLFAGRVGEPVDWRAPAPAPEPMGRRMRLTTGWPMLRLGDDALARLRELATTDPASSGSGHETDPGVRFDAPLPPHGPATVGAGHQTQAGVAFDAPLPPHDPAPVGAGHETQAGVAINAPPAAQAGAGAGVGAAVALAPTPAPAVDAAVAGAAVSLAPAPAPAVDDAEAALALDAHLQTMGRFLATSGDVMRAYLGDAEAPAARHTDPQQPTEPQPHPAADPPTATHADSAGDWPLLGEIVAEQPGESLVARRVADPAHDRYLVDHALGREVSRLQPQLSALQLMPLAMSIEILAEGASRLLPGLVVTGLRDVRGHRWLDFEHGPRTLQVTARRLDPTSEPDQPAHRVAVTLATIEADGEARPVAEATALLADCYTATPAQLPAPHGLSPQRLTRGNLYDDAMFHGPLWQGVAALETITRAGALARLRVPARHELIADNPAPRFILDPVTLDAAGQVVGFWAADQLTEGRVVFPFRLAALDLHAPPPAEGQILRCVAHVTLVGTQLTTSEIEVSDGRSASLMRLRAWEDKRFEVPARFAPIASPRPMAPLSSAWAPSLPDAADARISCRRLDSRLPADASLWRPVWSQRVLGARERAQLAARPGPESRQLERLGARTAAKEALAELLRARTGADLLPADIEILTDEQGRPHVTLAADTAPLAVAPLVSLSHSDGEAVAAVALADPGAPAGLGIDIERLIARAPGFADAALRPAEQQLLAEAAARRPASDPDTDSDEWTLRCWCAKEAAGKATGGGMQHGSDGPQITDIDLDQQRIGVTVDGQQITAQTSRDDDLVVAVAAFGLPGTHV